MQVVEVVVPFGGVLENSIRRKRRMSRKVFASIKVPPEA
jgi:hypothetical protein